MPSFNAQAIVAKVRTGNGVIILAGDVPVGFAQTSTQSLALSMERFFGIGSKKVQEQQQLRYEPTITLDSLQLTNAGLSYFGYPSTWVEVLINTELNFTLADANGNAILTFVSCTAENYSSTVPANQPITEATTFGAMDIWDTNGVSLLNDGTDALLVNAGAAAIGLASSAL
jgi:hypothetical protein